MTNEGAGEMIRARREALKIGQAELARRVGISQPSMNNIENGKTKRSRYLPEIAAALGLDQNVLINPGSKTHQNIVDKLSPRPESRSARDFPVYFMEVGEREGVFVITAEAVEWVERPALLATVKSSFGICVYGDTMAPAYEAGDIIFVHPYQPPVAGSDVVLRPSDKDDHRIILGRLASETATDWKILQHKANKHMTLSKAEWGRCDRIVGKYNRR